MKYIFYSVTALGALFIFMMFMPSPQDAKDKVCSTLYERYNQELQLNSTHVMELSEIEESCR